MSKQKLNYLQFQKIGMNMQFFHIKKGELFLAESKNINDEIEYDDYSDIQTNSTVQFKWTENIDDAKVFTSWDEPTWFLGKKRGAFWRGAAIVIKGD